MAALVCSGILTLWIPAFWPVAVFQAAAFTLAGVVVWRSRNRLPPFPYPLAPLVVAVACGLAQCLSGHTAYLFATQTATLQWAALLAVLLIGICLFADERTCRWFRSFMLWFAFAVAVLAILQTFTADGKVFWLFPSGYTDYVMGPFLSRNHYAVFVEAILPVALYEALRSDRDSFLYSGIAAVLYASVVASASRTGVVIVSGEILAVAGLMWAGGQTSGRAVGLSLVKIIAVFGVFTGVVGWQAVWNRLQALDPMSIRRELAVSTLRMIARHPWAGAGLGVWPTVYPRYAIVDIGAFANQAHNDWLQWAAEAGVPFALTMAGLFAWCVRASLRSVWGLGAVAVLLHALVDYPFSRPALGSWTILVIAMLASARSSEG
jgi:O-antigen ligase